MSIQHLKSNFDPIYILSITIWIAMGISALLNNLLVLLFVGFCGIILLLNHLIFSLRNTSINQQIPKTPKKPKKIKKVIEVLVDEDGNEIV